jgi:hypothetical protein
LRKIIARIAGRPLQKPVAAKLGGHLGADQDIGDQVRVPKARKRSMSSAKPLWERAIWR